MSASPELTRAFPEFTKPRVMAVELTEDQAALIPFVRKDSDHGYHTPQSKESKIPEVLWSCPPPAPKKRRPVTLLCKRRLSETEFFKVEAEEIDRLFGCNEKKSKIMINS
ncbi:hypothetical protein J5N97_023575 [Dioscorea zingiberensis]|uniref:Uncharacterized protein n=1 Tax=Dioscorea zingiberensis TaxID=325984 RepID=A0A9D5C5I1_9LILI|nr:hypothetical protein J5N97_023575 [Dioscorea zingiberensis]